MGTRSDIIVERADGKWARIYCHWDGYLSHNGVILQEHFATQERAEALVALGDISSLKPSIEKPEGHTFDNAVDGHTVFYGRDRGETDAAARIFDTLSEAWPEEGAWTEFTYVWSAERQAWGVGNPDHGSQAIVPLADAIAGTVDIEAPVKVPFWGTIGRHNSGPKG